MTEENQTEDKEIVKCEVILDSGCEIRVADCWIPDARDSAGARVKKRR